MKPIILLFILFCFVNVYASEECPNEKGFLDTGWIVHSEKDFDKILEEKLILIA